MSSVFITVSSHKYTNDDAVVFAACAELSSFTACKHFCLIIIALCFHFDASRFALSPLCDRCDASFFPC